VLSHYDGVESKAESLVLGSGGAIASLDNGPDDGAVDGLGIGGRGTGAGWDAMAVPQSLQVAKSVASDFLTASEVKAQGFKKPKKMRKKKDKASMRTKSSADDDDEDAGAPGSSSSSAAAPMNDEDGDVDDDAAGSRKNRNGSGAAAAVAAKLAESARLSAFAAAKVNGQKKRYNGMCLFGGEKGGRERDRE